MLRLLTQRGDVDHRPKPVRAHVWQKNSRVKKNGTARFRLRIVSWLSIDAAQGGWRTSGIDHVNGAA